MKPNLIEEYYIGIMSGTSMDGIDAVCAAYRDNQLVNIIGHYCLSYSSELKQKLLALQNITFNELHISQIISDELTELYIKVVKQLLIQINLTPQQINAIGCHGQTIRHCPEFHYSIQLANWAKLAEETQIKVVGDFRTTDLVAGGEGAPLVPLFHQIIFSHPSIPRIILNIGGIANITVLNSQQATFGFDTGPGNMLIDAWCAAIWHKNYDKDGYFSQQGQVLTKLLKKLLSIDYFQIQPPKSTGRDLFSLEWLKSFLSSNENPFDVARTLVELTALTISDAIKTQAPNTQEVYICGGGVYNTTLYTRLKQLLNPIEVHSIEKLNMDPLQVEATAFSWLALRRIKNLTGNLPNSTNARGTRVLGALWEPFSK